jgi:hypothetical protein
MFPPVNANIGIVFWRRPPGRDKPVRADLERGSRDALVDEWIDPLKFLNVNKSLEKTVLAICRYSSGAIDGGAGTIKTKKNSELCDLSNKLPGCRETCARSMLRARQGTLCAALPGNQSRH